MKRLSAVPLFVFLAVSALAQPTITSITPNSGPTAGGTEVVITGSGFSTCEICSPPIPPGVFFGGTPAPQTTMVNGNTLRVITPAHLPGLVSVSVQQHNGFTTMQNAFSFTGSIEEGFHRVLFPLLTGPVNGAFGSRFITELRMANSSETVPARFFGLLPQCILSACIFFDPLEQPYEIEAGGSHGPESVEYTGRPGAFIYVPKSSPQIEFNLRVHDQTRSDLNFCTEMPVVYDREFTFEPIKLLGVPTDPRFRNTLRIYADKATEVTVEFGDFLEVVNLRPGVNAIDQAYAQLGDIGGSGGTVDVTVTPFTPPFPIPGVEPVKIWAFISVTNNETQLITTITPQR